tara:strand:- start:370 stop:1095 length:726 start_codon:yes stop_codon:yes gene_type:complete
MKWIKIILQFIFFIGVIFLLTFTNTQNSDRICIDYRINIDNETTSLVTRSEIIKLMYSVKESIVGTNVNEVPIYEIEQKIECLNNIQNAEVYINMQGILFVELIQKKPIVRISPIMGNDFYMDALGSIFGLSNNYTEHVLVANGNIQDTTDYVTVLNLAKQIYSDSIWSSQIIQIYIKENKEIELVPRVGNHIILLGDITNYKDKLRKLYLFYDKGVNHVGWNDYKEINLKFRNQIVCLKK